MDFALTKYFELLDALKEYGVEELTLRHDVDQRPANSLRTAQIEVGNIFPFYDFHFMEKY